MVRLPALGTTSRGLLVAAYIGATWILSCSSTSTNVSENGGAKTDAATGGGSGTGGAGGNGATSGAPAGGTGASGGGDAGGVSGSTADSGGNDACAPKAPLAAYDATLSGGCGVACAPENVLIADDANFAGLDCIAVAGEIVTSLAGEPVTGCVGVDFGAVMNLDPIVIRMKADGNSCGGACYTPPGSPTTQCGTGDVLDVFRGDQLGTYVFVQQLPVASTLAEVAVNLTVQARYVVACRSGSGPARDDVQIDGIWSTACP